jgi:hypothetical protein
MASLQMRVETVIVMTDKIIPVQQSSQHNVPAKTARMEDIALFGGRLLRVAPVYSLFFRLSAHQTMTSVITSHVKTVLITSTSSTPKTFVDSNAIAQYPP